MSAHPSPTEKSHRFIDASPGLAKIFRRYADDAHMPSVTYGVVVDANLEFSTGFGTTDVSTEAEPDADTVYRIASMTKSFAAAAVLRLRDCQRLRLDDPVTRYVPELASLRYPTQDSPLLTIRDLLTMSAGWPQDDPWGDRQTYRDNASMSRLYASGVTFSNPPGVRFEYSNLGYMVLGRIISEVSGESALDFIERELLEPLSMTSTGWRAVGSPAARTAHGYRWEQGAWREEETIVCGGDVAAFAGLYSTVRDLARWVGLFQASWPPRDDIDDGPLSRGSLREMQRIWNAYPPVLEQPRIDCPAQTWTGGYGYGLSTIDNGRYRTVGHGGGFPGFGSHMRWAPDYRVGVIALSNLTYANVHDACEDALAELITQTERPVPTPVVSAALRSAHDDVHQLMNGWSEELADRVFADNFFLDRDRGDWRTRLSELRQTHGRFSATDSIRPRNWLRGSRRLTGERGWCDAWLTLSPTVPPRVQALELRSTLPLSAAMWNTAKQIVELIRRPVRRELDRLLATDCDRSRAWNQIRLANVLHGECRVSDTRAGDGENLAELELRSPTGRLRLKLVTNDRGKLRELTLAAVEAAVDSHSTVTD